LAFGRYEIKKVRKIRTTGEVDVSVDAASQATIYDTGKLDYPVNLKYIHFNTTSYKMRFRVLLYDENGNLVCIHDGSVINNVGYWIGPETLNSYAVSNSTQWFRLDRYDTTGNQYDISWVPPVDFIGYGFKIEAFNLDTSTITNKVWIVYEEIEL